MIDGIVVFFFFRWDPLTNPYPCVCKEFRATSLTLPTVSKTSQKWGLNRAESAELTKRNEHVQPTANTYIYIYKYHNFGTY